MRRRSLPIDRGPGTPRVSPDRVEPERPPQEIPSHTHRYEDESPPQSVDGRSGGWKIPSGGESESHRTDSSHELSKDDEEHDRHERIV